MRFFMPIFEKKEISINYEVIGEGKPLLLIQGLGEKLCGWDYQKNFFKDKFKVIVFDNRGVGKSSRPNYPYTMEMYVNDTNTLIDYLDIKDKMVIVGLSMGGMIAQNFVLKYPEKVKCLILIATSAKLESSDLIENIKMIAKEDELTRIWKNFAVYFSKSFREKIRGDPTLFEKLKSDMLTDETRVQDFINQSEAIRNTHDTKSNLDKIKIPTLIIAAEKDLLVPIHHLNELHKNIPNSQLEIIKGAGHIVTIEEYERVNQLIWDFIQEHG